MKSWDPELYERFKRERELPFDDTLALVTRRPGLRVVDLGCGTGELTARLADALPGSDVLGIDSSAAMLARAPSRPGLRFAQRQIEALDGQYDLIFSHAALHWVEDHATLIPRILGTLAPGGQLVVQMPSNHDHPAHQILGDVAGWRRVVPVLQLADYAELLWAHGGRELTVLEKVYPHEMPNADALLEWLSATTLLPYLERLDEAGKPAYREAVRQRLRARWPTGPFLFAFKRIIFAARRA